MRMFVKRCVRGCLLGPRMQRRKSPDLRMRGDRNNGPHCPGQESARDNLGLCGPAILKCVRSQLVADQVRSDSVLRSRFDHL